MKDEERRIIIYISLPFWWQYFFLAPLIIIVMFGMFNMCGTCIYPRLKLLYIYIDICKYFAIRLQITHKQHCTQRWLMFTGRSSITNYLSLEGDDWCLHLATLLLHLFMFYLYKITYIQLFLGMDYGDIRFSYNFFSKYQLIIAIVG